jgi:hypothetical protein
MISVSQHHWIRRSPARAVTKPHNIRTKTVSVRLSAMSVIAAVPARAAQLMGTLHLPSLVRSHR